MPSFWNDQTGYWHYALTFSQVGFNGGYYSANEIPARASFFRFDVHGPMFPMIYGTIGRLIGWQWYSGIVANMMVLAVAIALFAYTTKLTKLQMAFTGLLVLTFWPVLLYVPTTSQESFHQAVAFILAALFYRLLTARGERSTPEKLLFLLFLTTVSLVRTSWALLSVPFFMLASMPYFSRPRDATTTKLVTDGLTSNTRHTRLFHVLLSLSLGMSFIGAAFTVVRYISAPGLNSIVTIVKGLEASSTQGMRSWWKHIDGNLRSWFVFTGPDVEIAHRILVMGLIIAVGIGLALLMVANKRVPASERHPIWGTELCFHLFNLGSILIATIAVYLLPGAFRVIGAHLLLSLLLMLRFGRFALVGAAILVNVLVTPSFLAEYDKWKINFDFNHSELHALRASLEDHIRYDAGARNPWCNTMLIPINYYDFRVTLVPAGIGISYITDRAMLQRPLKSRYLLFDKPTYDLLAGEGGLNVPLISDMPIGRLYRNLDADCETNGQRP